MIKLAIDLGSSMTKIYRADTNSGIVLAEPSCVAVGVDGEVKAIGKEAKNLIGKTTERMDIINPVFEGIIKNMELAVVMLRDFLARIGIKKNALRSAQVLFSVPCGLGGGLLADYGTLAEECGLYKARFVEQPYVAALGGGVILSDGEPVFCVDIGGGVANAAVISANGIIKGIALNVGGNNMDANIISRIAQEKNLHIGTLMAERLKNELGSMSFNPRGSKVAEGSSTLTYLPDSRSVEAVEISDCLSVCVNKVIEYAKELLVGLDAEVAAAVHRNGVYLSGGVMKIAHMPQYISTKMGMHYHVCEEPQFASVLGGGMLLSEKEFLNRFSKEV